MRALSRFVPYLVRTITRARLRSGLTILGAALAMGLFAFVFMLDHGVRRLEAATENPLLIVFQTSRFCPLTSNLPLRYRDKIEKVEGVSAVLPTLLHINSCRANLDLVTLHGVEPALLGEVHDFALRGGDLTSWSGETNGALVGARLAKRRQLAVGDRLQLGAIDLRVAGIFESEDAALDNFAFVHLDRLSRARNREGEVSEFFVRLDPGADPEAVAARIDTLFASEEEQTDTKTMQAFVQGALSEVAEVVDFARLLGILAVAVVVFILSNTVGISAQTRQMELGVLETVGVTRPLLVGLVLLEGAAIGLAGGLLGVGGTSLFTMLRPITLGVEGWGVDIHATPQTFLVGLGVAALVGVGAAVPAAAALLRRPLARAVTST